MANRQVTIRATADGIDPAWTILRSEDESDAAAQEILANDLSRRFSTKPNTYFTDPSYGLDLEDYMGKGVTAESLGRLVLAMKAQAEDDERVEHAKAEVVSVTGLYTPSVTVKIRLTIVPKKGETFERTFVLTSDKITLLRKSA